ncbi:MAG: RND transporter [Desulfuromonas sp.]|nr:MAG: RND transporter [Desulfuromonas sp.]
MRALPLATLVPIALLLGLAPFTPEPHLVEKARMLFHGELQRPIDIFDLFLHGTPLLLLLARLILARPATPSA